MHLPATPKRGVLIAAVVCASALAVGPSSIAGAAEQATGSRATSSVSERHSQVAVAIDVASDGTGPFSPTQQPGGDTDASNGIVRTLDSITYRVTVSSNEATSRNERFTVTAPPGTSWAGLPTSCRPGDGSGIDGRTLSCNLGTVPEGNAVATPVVLQMSSELRNGDAISVEAMATADNAGNGTVRDTSPVTSVSAAARYNLSQDLVASQLKADVLGPDGRTNGFQLVYPVSVDWQPLVAGQGLLGFEKSAGPMRFRDDVGRITGAVPSAAVLWNEGRPACGVNERNEIRFSGLPGGRGGGSSNVVDSGQFTCTQDRPGSSVELTITGTVTDPTSVPTQGLGGSVLTGGQKHYFAVGYVSFWMPGLPDGTSVESVNSFGPLRTESISGAPNFAGGAEPMQDNTARRNLVQFDRGGGYKTLHQIGSEGEVRNGSAKSGDPWVTPGQVLRSTVTARNDGLAPLRDSILCDTFDRSTQRLTRVGRSWATATTSDNATIEYRAYDMAAPSDGQTADCSDAAGPWFADPEDVPGGADAVGAVRVRTDIRGGTVAALYSYTAVVNAPDGTRVHDFGHLWFDGRPGGWVHDTTDPALGAGPLADSVLVTENLARIAKKIVDPEHDAEDTPDATSFVVAGEAIEYALYPSLTNGNANGRGAEVAVQDLLPFGTRYVAGSASITPVVDVVIDDDGRQRQRLTWSMASVRPNTVIAPITYRASVSPLAVEGSVVNTATIDSPSDRSEERQRTADRAVRIVAASGLGVEKTAVRPVVTTGDPIHWTLAFVNTDAAPVLGTDLIDVLPHTGDAVGSRFHGSVHLAGPVPAHTAEGEAVRYTSAPPAAVSLDGGHESNRSGGATRWCGETAFGTSGCPTGFEEVTAFRIERSTPVAPSETVSHRLTVRTEGQREDDRYTNRFGLRASNLPLPVRSNTATVRVVAGSIGDRVWDDLDEDGLQGREPGVAGVPVELSGTDDEGTIVTASTTTEADGHYAFDGLRPGEYRIRWTAPAGRSFTERRSGGDRGADSDASADGTSSSVSLTSVLDGEGVLAGITRDDSVDAGLVGSGVPGSPTDPPSPSGGAPQDGSDLPQGVLAFTGTGGVAAAVAAALALVLAGAFLLVTRGRRGGRS